MSHHLIVSLPAGLDSGSGKTHEEEAQEDHAPSKPSSGATADEPSALSENGCSTIAEDKALEVPTDPFVDTLSGEGSGSSDFGAQSVGGSSHPPRPSLEKHRRLVATFRDGALLPPISLAHDASPQASFAHSNPT